MPAKVRPFGATFDVDCDRHGCIASCFMRETAEARAYEHNLACQPKDGATVMVRHPCERGRGVLLLLEGRMSDYEFWKDLHAVMEKHGWRVMACRDVCPCWDGQGCCMAAQPKESANHG